MNKPCPKSIYAIVARLRKFLSNVIRMRLIKQNKTNSFLVKLNSQKKKKKLNKLESNFETTRK